MDPDIAMVMCSFVDMIAAALLIEARMVECRVQMLLTVQDARDAGHPHPPGIFPAIGSISSANPVPTPFVHHTCAPTHQRPHVAVSSVLLSRLSSASRASSCAPVGSIPSPSPPASSGVVVVEAGWWCHIMMLSRSEIRIV